MSIPTPEIEYEVYQNGEWCAGADRLADAEHYRRARP